METLAITSKKHSEMIDITAAVQGLVKRNNWQDGLLTVFNPHTTAGLTINENADPDVQQDLLYEINKIIPLEDGYRHFEGNSAAHLKASFFGSSLSIIIENERLQLGTWQGLYFCEFDGPRQRKVWIKFTGS